MLRLGLTLLALATPLPAVAAGCDPPAPLRFAPGTSGIEIHGAVPRGMRDCLTVGARAGQVLEASITSTERNATFQVHPPGWRVDRDPHGGVDVGKRGLAADDAMRTRITLPADGNYLIVIGTTRGSADYTLRVTIK